MDDGHQPTTEILYSQGDLSHISSTNQSIDSLISLQSIYNSDVAQLLGSQFEVPILADILAVLMQMFVADRQPIVNIMHGIVNNRQMSIVALLMTAEHKLTFTKLITYMRTTGETDPKRIDVIEKIFESYILPLN